MSLKTQYGREPLDFKVVQDRKSTHKLIERLRFADFTTKEPNPWPKKVIVDPLIDDEDVLERDMIHNTTNGRHHDEENIWEEDESDEEEGQGFLDSLSSWCYLM